MSARLTGKPNADRTAHSCCLVSGPDTPSTASSGIPCPANSCVDRPLLGGDGRIEHVAGVVGAGLAGDVVDLVAHADVEEVTGLDVIGISEVVLGLEVPVRHRRVGHRIGDQAERVAGLDLDHTVRIVNIGRVHERSRRVRRNGCRCEPVAGARQHTRGGDHDSHELGRHRGGVPASRCRKTSTRERRRRPSSPSDSGWARKSRSRRSSRMSDQSGLRVHGAGRTCPGSYGRGEDLHLGRRAGQGLHGERDRGSDHRPVRAGRRCRSRAGPTPSHLVRSGPARSPCRPAP